MDTKEKVEQAPETGDAGQTKEQPKTYSSQEYEELLKQNKGLERAVSDKASEMRRLQDKVEQMSSSQEMQQAMIAALAQQRGQSEEEVMDDIQQRKPDLQQQMLAILAKQKQDDQQREHQREEREYKQKADSIWDETLGLNLPRDDENVQDIYGFLTGGNLSRAENRLNKLKNQPREEVKMNQGEIDKLIAEKAEKLAEEKVKGLYPPNTTASSGGGNKQKFRRSQLGDYEFYKANKEGIDEAQRLGNIIED